MTNAPLQILLADDHPLLLQGTQTLLENQPGCQIKSVATTGTEAADFLRHQKYDLAILDYELPGFLGTELVRIGLKENPDLNIIMLSMHDEPTVIRELFDLGVKGYVLKTGAHQELIEALEAVKKGETYFSPSVKKYIDQNEGVTNLHELLSARELEIVKLIVRDYSTKQIADILFISIKTVETHRKNILRKTGCATSIGLVSYAHEHNLV
jgi:two-component system nitrate/nitrite response regulator NarL